jgi:hypothetical protein
VILMMNPAAASSAPSQDVSAAVRSRDHVTRLSEVLEVIALEALGRDRPMWLQAPEGTRVRSAIGEPVAAATGVAIDRLAAELASVLERGIPDSRRHLDDERRRTELGYD